MAIRIHFDALFQDVRYTCRFLVKEWTFAIPVLVTVALSTGSTSAVFTLVDALLLRDLPVRSPEQLVSIGAPGRNADLNPSYFSHVFYEHLRDSNSLVGDLIATSTAVSSGVNLTDGSTTNRVRGELVSGNYFDVLGVRLGGRQGPDPGRRSDARRASGPGPQRRLLATSLRRSAGHRRTDPVGQRPSVHGCRGREARVLRDEARLRSGLLGAAHDGPGGHGRRHGAPTTRRATIWN